jgi:hypothetical protein
MRSARRPETGSNLALLGFALTLVIGGWLSLELTRKIPPAVVSRCASRHSHYDYFDLTIDQGTILTLSTQQVPSWKHCPDPGTIIEKRIGELGWRVNGAYQSVHRPTFAIAFALTVSGPLLVIGGLAWRRTANRQRQGAAP